MSKEISITKTYDLAKPQEVLQMANVLKAYVVKQGLFTNIKGKNYAHVDGWQFAGFLSGLSAVIDSVEDLSNDKETKWNAVAKIYRGEKLISIGFALCSSKEANKKGFEEYAVLSMAQTRAIGKVYRNLIGWVMKLAGYESTPSEEMHKVDEVQKSQDTQVVPEQGFEDHVCVWKGCGKYITKQEANYSMKLFKRELCRVHQTESKKK